MDFIDNLRRASLGARLDNFAYFYPNIIVGAGFMLTPEFMHENSITHVINCAFEEHSPVWFKQIYPEKYVCLNALDGDVDILQWYPKFKEYMDKFIKDKESNKIFVHCQWGMNRSGFLTLAYVCKEYNLTMKQVMVNTLCQRPCLYQNRRFLKDVSCMLNNG